MSPPAFLRKQEGGRINPEACEVNPVTPVLKNAALPGVTG